MPFEIVRNDIARMRVDAIVNAAHHLPKVGAGVDSALHQKAGPALLAARQEIGVIPYGSAAVTPAFALDAKYVIHAATPIWMDGGQGELQLLRQTYDVCLDLALRHGCESVAFPLLASGNHGFPKSKALQTAISAFSEFLMEHDMQIYLVVFGKDSLTLSEKLVQSVRSYIDENYVAAYEQATYGSNDASVNYSRIRRRRERELMADCMAAPYAVEATLDEYIRKKDAGFTETLLSLIEKSGQKNSTIYKKANISKQHFSKIINDPHAKPSKATTIALALALELDLDATRDLIGRAGYALTNSSFFDLVICYYIEHKQYNDIEINITLYEMDQPLLGG